MRNSPIERLSNELLSLILADLEPDPDKVIPIDKRQFLSVESFHRPPHPQRGSLRDIGNFRRASKKCATVGAPFLFTRVAGRFSQQGLERLETLATWPHLTRHVKKFTYLVPYFYSDDSVDSQTLQSTLARTGLQLNLRAIQQKIREQREIRDSGRDVEILKKAISSFTSLQLVQLLRVADDEDEKLLSYIRQHGESSPLVKLEWASACLHSSRTIGMALLTADVPWSRFSSPMLSPQSAEFLATKAPRQVDILAARLTCLSLHFEDGNDLNQKIIELSGLFKTVLTTAKGMQAIHVGFPSHRPLNLPLEDLFHNITFDRLVAFGVQGWNLHADEILHLALRHREKLKGLRLRDVRLKRGSMWKDVLNTLRSSALRLEWVSLRRIDYVEHFEDSWVGIEVPDDPPPTQSDSDSESESDSDDEPEGCGTMALERQYDRESFTNEDDTDSESGGSTDGRESGMNEMDFPPLDSPVTPAAPFWCSCDESKLSSSLGQLEDDGYTVSNAKRKLWEKWVVRRCPEHGT